MANVVKISEAASLAMHTAVLLAANPNKRLSARQIATHLHASEAHLAKVMQRLSRERMVRSVRGPQGGFLLARPAREVTLLDIFEAIEGRLEAADCLLNAPVCGGGSLNCILGNMLHSVNDQVHRYLEGRTLAELADGFINPFKEGTPPAAATG